MTEGPWKVSGRQKKTEIGGFSVIAPSGGSAIAYVAYDDDASLIAAAPELLDALKETTGPLMAYNGYGWPDRDKVIERVRAAIAKAEGQ